MALKRHLPTDRHRITCIFIGPHARSSLSLPQGEPTIASSKFLKWNGTTTNLAYYLLFKLFYWTRFFSILTCFLKSSFGKVIFVPFLQDFFWPAFWTWLQETLSSPLLLLKCILVLLFHQPWGKRSEFRAYFLGTNLQLLELLKMRAILGSPPVQSFCFLLPLLHSACWLLCLLVHFFFWPKNGAFEALSETSQPWKVNNVQ